MTEPPPLTHDQTKTDTEHLRLLSVFHLVLAGLSVLGIGFLGLHYVMMRLMFTNPEMWKNAHGGPPPDIFFSVFRWFYAVFGALIAAGGVGNFLSGLFIRRRTNRTFSIVMAGINCISFPFGTLLGVFTIIVLLRASVREIYEDR
jgi:hypothetical protein